MCVLERERERERQGNQDDSHLVTEIRPIDILFEQLFSFCFCAKSFVFKQILNQTEREKREKRERREREREIRGKKRNTNFQPDS